MGKGDARRPALVSAEAYAERWERAFNPERLRQVDERGRAGFGKATEQEESSVGGPNRYPTESFGERIGTPGIPRYEWAVYFRHAGEKEQLAGEFEKNDTANVFASKLRANGATTRVERIA